MSDNSESNALPLEQSLISRPLRLLFSRGRPIDPVVLLNYQMGEGKSAPIGIISKTPGNRLIFWPATPTNVRFEHCGGRQASIDHVTLELANRETHLTEVDCDGNRTHIEVDWGLRKDADTRPSLWLMFSGRHDVLSQQCGVFESSIPSPRSDVNRREQEYVKFAQSFQTVDVPVPTTSGDYVLCCLFLVPKDWNQQIVDPSWFPMGPWLDEWVQDLPNGNQLLIAPAWFSVADVRILAFICCPPGILRADGFLGGLNAFPPAR